MPKLDLRRAFFLFHGGRKKESFVPREEVNENFTDWTLLSQKKKRKTKNQRTKVIQKDKKSPLSLYNKTNDDPTIDSSQDAGFFHSIFTGLRDVFGHFDMQSFELHQSLVIKTTTVYLVTFSLFSFLLMKE